MPSAGAVLARSKSSLFLSVVTHCTTRRTNKGPLDPILGADSSVVVTGEVNAHELCKRFSGG